jgi:hypothetical protein
MLYAMMMMMLYLLSDDEPRRIQVTIKPVDDRMSQTASVDEIKKITESLSLSSPSSMVNI